MILAKNRKPFPIKLYALPLRGGAWRVRVSIPDYSQPTIFDTDDFDFSGVNQTAVEIGNVYIDGVRYEETESTEECLATRKRWYFDKPNQLLDVFPSLGTRLDSSSFNTAIIRGHSSEGVFYDSDDNEYLPFVRSNLKITESADRVAYEKITFPMQSITFDNSDGDFDSYYDDPANGSDVEYQYLATADYMDGKTNFIDVYVGYVSADSIDDEYTLSIKDKRAQLSDTWPKETFNATDYTDIEDDLVGVTIPDGFGEYSSLPAYCVNGGTTTGNVKYKLGNSGTAITSAQVLIDKEWTSVTLLNSAPSTLEFEVSAAEARDSDGNYYECRAVAEMRPSTGQIGIMIALMEEAGIPYNTEYWDMFPVAKELAKYGSSDCNLYTDEEQEFYEYIEQIQGGGEYGFKLFVTPSGLWTIQFDDLERDVAATYDYTHNISDISAAERDFSDYATSVAVDYGYNPKTEGYKTVLYDTDEQNIYNEYLVYQKKTFTSMLTLEASALSKATLIQKDYAVVRGQITFTIDEIAIHHVFDVVTVETSKYIDGEVVREYLGWRTIKLSRIVYDFDKEQTTLTGYDISDIIAAGMPTYAQGILHGTRACGHRVCGATSNYTPEAV